MFLVTCFYPTSVVYCRKFLKYGLLFLRMLSYDSCRLWGFPQLPSHLTVGWKGLQNSLKAVMLLGMVFYPQWYGDGIGDGTLGGCTRVVQGPRLRLAKGTEAWGRFQEGTRYDVSLSNVMEAIKSW